MSLGITAAPRNPLPDYSLAGGEPIQRHFSPYNDNGGTTAAIAGDDFVVVASDTRLTDGGYGILSRNLPKLFNLTDGIVLGATGCWADVLTLTRLIGARIKIFKYTHNAQILSSECSQMLANMLYAKRFFPYSVTNILVRSDIELHNLISSFDIFLCDVRVERNHEKMTQNYILCVKITLNEFGMKAAVKKPKELSVMAISQSIACVSPRTQLKET